MLTREIFGSHYDEGRITSSVEDHAPTAFLTKNSIKSYMESEHLSGDYAFFDLNVESESITNLS